MLKPVVRLARPRVRNGDSEHPAAVPVHPPRSQPVAIRTEASGAPLIGPSDVASADWDTLFGAVLARLRRGVAEPPVADGALVRDPAAPLRTIVQECTAALDQLHATLVQELGLRQQLELDLFDERTALAQVRAELAGTRDGERRARHLALHDGLTSLPNRTHFRARLDDALGPGAPLRKPLAVLYLDLDGFKPINDTRGHEVGDELLRIIAARLARAVRASDVVGRLGGDEFACLLADLPGHEQLCHLACKLFDAVSAPVKVGTLRLTVRPSIGIAVCPTDGASTDELLKSADAAMYAAKRDRSGYAFFACGSRA